LTLDDGQNTQILPVSNHPTTQSIQNGVNRTK
jgi:hypothetical protein